MTIIRRELCPPLFDRSEPVRFFLFGMFKGKQYSNNPRTEDDLKVNSK